MFFWRGHAIGTPIRMTAVLLAFANTPGNHFCVAARFCNAENSIVFLVFVHFSHIHTRMTELYE